MHNANVAAEYILRDLHMLFRCLYVQTDIYLISLQKDYLLVETIYRPRTWRMDAGTIYILWDLHSLADAVNLNGSNLALMKQCYKLCLITLIILITIPASNVF